jgi:hypothetical protein
MSSGNYGKGLLTAAGARFVLAVIGFIAPFVLGARLLGGPWALLVVACALVLGIGGAIWTALAISKLAEIDHEQ